MPAYQISHDNMRAEQLTTIMDLRKDLPRNPEKAAAVLLFEHYDEITGGKRA